MAEEQEQEKKIETKRMAWQSHYCRIIKEKEKKKVRDDNYI